MTTTTVTQGAQTVQLFAVKTLAGQKFNVQGKAEKDFYEGQQKKYQAENSFTAATDLQDLDRLLFLELLVYRATCWLGSGMNYSGELLLPSEEADCRKVIKENSPLISQLKNDLTLTKSQRDKEQYECHDDETEVLTEHGWKLFADVLSGERVATRSPDGTLEYQLPSAHHAAHFEGELIGYSTNRLDFRVTPNHRMLVLQNGREVVYEAGNLNPARLQYELVKIAAIPDRPSGSVVFEGLPPVSRETFARLLGFWLAEGSITLPPYEIRVTQSKPAGIAWFDSLVVQLGWTFKRYKYGREVVWVIRNRELFKYLRDCCVGGHELAIPDEVFLDWSRSEMEALLEGLMTGDGTSSERDGLIRYYTSSLRLAGDVQRLLAHIDRTGWVRMSYPAGARMSTGVVATRPGYAVCIRTARRAVLYGKELQRFPYSGMVYCLTVPNGTLLTRRNGLTLWSGNSVGSYIKNLQVRAREFGIHRETQLRKALCLINELFALLGAYDRADEVERQKLGLESPEEILDWIRTVMRPEYDKVDEYFRNNAQRAWVRDI